MRLSYAWIKEWVSGIDPDPTVVANRLTMAGLEVDSLERAAPPFSRVIVGLVETVVPHSNAKRLNVCTVNDGRQRHQVVCGAPNVHSGMKAPFALPEACLPDGNSIQATVIRGIESNGMLCSASELGLAEASAGLLELPKDAPVGLDFREYWDLDDWVLDIDLTPNRSDCLSVRGIAREASVLMGGVLQESAPPMISETHSEKFPVRIDAFDACPHYVGRIIKNVDVQAETPVWMRERLRRSGVRCISLPVDITNYVMLELGQPMHAFDYDRLHEGIIVRWAQPGEALELLDGQQVALSSETLVIADHQQPLAIAGIMGGAESAVTSKTANVFLEAAFFEPSMISGRARSLGLNTESSHRFERGVDPSRQVEALNRATELLMMIGGGSPGPVTDARDLQHVRQGSTVSIELRAGQIQSIAGYSFDLERVETILVGLGCVLESKDQGWEVTPPSWRFDLRIEADLIEELLRVDGYDRVPEKPLKVTNLVSRAMGRFADTLAIKTRMREQGYQEVITYSFISETWAKRFALSNSLIQLMNPISTEMAVMRPTLWPGLLEVLRHNKNRQKTRGLYFEIGDRFEQMNEKMMDTPALAGLGFGSIYPEQWGFPSRKIDFFDIKGHIQNLFDDPDALVWEKEEHPALHPGQSARITCAGRHAGWVGRIHPLLAKEIDLADDEIYLFELNLELVLEKTARFYQPFSKYPAIRRDLSLLLADSIPVADVLSYIKSLKYGTLRNVFVFDKYQGQGIPDGFQSLALGFLWQDMEKSLKDIDIDDMMNMLTRRLEEKFGLTIRGERA